MREKIAEILKHRGIDTLFNEHVMGVYGKEDAPNCENYINTTADQIIEKICEEIKKKGLPTNTELLQVPIDCYRSLHDQREVVKAVIKKILALLRK